MTGYDNIVEALADDSSIDSLSQCMAIRVPEDKHDKAVEVIKENGGSVHDSFTYEGERTISFGISE